jgi:hypothetical protein
MIGCAPLRALNRNLTPERELERWTEDSKHLVTVTRGYLGYTLGGMPKRAEFFGRPDFEHRSQFN